MRSSLGSLFCHPLCSNVLTFITFDFRALPGKFAIGAKTGTILTTKSEIDYEEFKAFNITVMATDNGIPAMNVSKIVTIKVKDVNHPPTDILYNGTEVSNIIVI